MADAHLHWLLRSQRDVQAVDQGRLFARREQAPGLQLRLQASLIVRNAADISHRMGSPMVKQPAGGSMFDCRLSPIHRQSDLPTSHRISTGIHGDATGRALLSYLGQRAKHGFGGVLW
jgi:hypothetical protein